MQPARKPKVDIIAALTARAGQLDHDIRQFFATIQYKLTHLPQTNFELGQKFMERGDVRDATLRFRVALYFAPNFTEAWYNLGRCYLARGENDKAAHAFKRTLQLQPTHTDAKYMLATIDARLLSSNDRPTRMPTHMMEGFFTSIAMQYDVMEQQAGYRLPKACYDSLRTRLTGTGLRVLDIGCGTGLSAAPWRKDARVLVGVDITPAMAERARMARIEGAPIFDSVLTADAHVQGLTLPQAPFDVVLIINVLSYAGEPKGIVANAAALVNAGGFVGISFEPYSGAEGYSVLPDSSRFGHSAEYILRLAQAAGLSLVEQAQMPMYETTKVAWMVFTKQRAAA